MPAVTKLILATLKAGDHAILSNDIDGGTVRLFVEILKRHEVPHCSDDTFNAGAFQRGTRCILFIPQCGISRFLALARHLVEPW